MPTAEELRAKYRAERDKRLRADGNEQYVEPTGRFSHFVEDPWTPRVDCDAVRCEVEVAVIGAGFAAQAWGLRTAGVTFAVAIGVLAASSLAAILWDESRTG